MNTGNQNPRTSGRGVVKPEELAHRVKWLATEMDTVGSAMLRQAKSTGDDALRSAGWDLHDAASALLTAIKDKT